MSGDVQPRKRKDKRKKKDEEEFVHHGIGNSDEVIHIYKESKLGGNICAKIVFFGLLGALGLMVGLIIIEYHGTSDVDTASAVDSPWSVMLEGWVDNSPDDHGDEHGGGEDDEHDEHDHDDDNHDQADEHDDHDNEYSEGEHDHEEEIEEETDDETYVKQTYEELRAAYTQAPTDEGESDVDITEESNVKSTEYGTTESEPEASEPDEENEEDVLQEDEPLPQWKSESGPDLLAEEVADVQTGSETEEESEEEAVTSTSGGPKSVEMEDEQESQNFVDETIPEPVVNVAPEQQESENKDESAEYEKADVTNPVDWEIREELDEAEKDLDEGDFLNPSSALSKFTALLSTHPLSPRALHGKAQAIDALAEIQHSNSLLAQAITAYSVALKTANIPDLLLLRMTNRTINRMRFKGLHHQAVEVHNILIDKFPDNITHQIELAITFLMINSMLQVRQGP